MGILTNLAQRLAYTIALAWYGLLFAPPRRQSGQSLIEMALVIAVIAIVVVPAMQVLRNGFASAYMVHQGALALPSASATPTP